MIPFVYLLRFRGILRTPIGKIRIVNQDSILVLTHLLFKTGFCYLYKLDTILPKKHFLPTIIDVGANIGDFTLAMSRDCGRIVALEPGFQNFKTLVSNVKVNLLSNVIPMNVAAHDSSEELTLIGENPDLRVDRLGDGPKVKGISLDEVVRQQDIKRVDLLKIDVQGHEMTVLRGMSGILQRHSAGLVIVEVHLERGTSLQEVISTMNFHGYRFLGSDDYTPRNPQLYFNSNYDVR